MHQQAPFTVQRIASPLSSGLGSLSSKYPLGS